VSCNVVTAKNGVSKRIGYVHCENLMSSGAVLRILGWTCVQSSGPSDVKRSGARWSTIDEPEQTRTGYHVRYRYLRSKNENIVYVTLL